MSLRTKDIKVAVRRKRLLDLIDGEQMFRMNLGDLKLMFEYDTEEELRTALEAVKEMQIQAQLQRFKEVKAHVESAEIETPEITFEKLRDRFMLSQKREGRSAEAIAEYLPTFKKLIKYFKEKNVYDLSVEDFKNFKDHLSETISRTGDPLSKKTVNKHLIYLKNFLKEIKLDNTANEIPLYKKSVVKKESPKKENYTLAEMRTIINYPYKNPIMRASILIAAYTGMRQGEIRRLAQEDIKRDERTGIYYFDIPEAKSEAGVRLVPIHKDIEALVLSLSFPLVPELVDNKGAFSKRVRYALYKAVNAPGKNFHTLRANFIDAIIENNSDSNNPFALHIIQEIVGHDEGDKVKLTVHTYKKGFRLTDKKVFMDKADY